MSLFQINICTAMETKAVRCIKMDCVLKVLSQMTKFMYRHTKVGVYCTNQEVFAEKLTLVHTLFATTIIKTSELL